MFGRRPVTSRAERSAGSHSSRSVWLVVLLAVPLIAALRALSVNSIPNKVLVPVSAAVVVAVSLRGAVAWRWRIWLINALLFSGAGDIFLSTDDRDPELFLMGTTLYLFAHVAYAVMALIRGRIQWAVLAVSATLLCGYVGALLLPGITIPVIGVAMVVYALASAVSLAGAAGVDRKTLPAGAAWSRIRLCCAILLIIFSDFLIAENLFRDNPTWNALISPTYYGAHLLFTLDALRTR